MKFDIWGGGGLKIDRENPSLIKIRQEKRGTLDEDQNKFTIISCLILFKIRNIGDKNQNTFDVQ